MKETHSKALTQLRKRQANKKRLAKIARQEKKLKKQSPKGQ